MNEQRENDKLDDKDVIKIHDILREQLINEGRLFSERMAAVALSNSVLFVGFFYSLDEGTSLVSYCIPIFGILLSILFMGIFWTGYDTSRKLRKAILQIEQEPYFERIKAKKLRLFSDIFSKDSLTLWDRGEAYFSVITSLIIIILWGICIYYV